MSLSTKLLLRVTFPVVVLFMALLALFHAEWKSRILDSASEEMTRSVSYAAQIVDERVDAVKDGLDRLLNSHALGQWAILDRPSARAEALLAVERASHELVNRVGEFARVFQIRGLSFHP